MTNHSSYDRSTLSASTKVRRFSLVLEGRPPFWDLIAMLRRRYRSTDDAATREQMVTLIRLLQVQRRESASK